MLTTRQITALRLLATVVVVIAGLAFAGHVQAQQSYWVQQPATLVWHPVSVHYDQVRTTRWHWTPQLGWHGHYQYVYVPHWVAGHWAPVVEQYTVVENR